MGSVLVLYEFAEGEELFGGVMAVVEDSMEGMVC